ncbi:MAG TPA: hypothetical protein VIG69_08290 [Candidatus Methylomirabilis sp.]
MEVEQRVRRGQERNPAPCQEVQEGSVIREEDVGSFLKEQVRSAELSHPEGRRSPEDPFRKTGSGRLLPDELFLRDETLDGSHLIRVADPSGHSGLPVDFLWQKADVLLRELREESGLMCLDEAIGVQYDRIHPTTSL